MNEVIRLQNRAINRALVKGRMDNLLRQDEFTGMDVSTDGIIVHFLHARLCNGPIVSLEYYITLEELETPLDSYMLEEQQEKQRRIEEALLKYQEGEEQRLHKRMQRARRRFEELQEEYGW